MKKVIVILASILLTCSLLSACGKAPAETAANGDPDSMAKQFLAALKNCPSISEEDNRMGFGIDRIEKDGDDYVVYWTASNELISANPSNEAYAFSLITFYDPADYANSYQGFTMEDGRMQVQFGVGESISYDHVRVSFPTDSKVVYLYFAGAEGPEEIYTVPLFYTLVLDDDPHVYESTPRAANGLFGA